MGAVDDIFEWSETKLSGWKRDAMRRLACSADLPNKDEDELLAMVKRVSGFDTPAPDVCPLKKEDFATAIGASKVRLKAIRNVQNVNRLVPSAEVNFSPSLTVIYGRNGSGKSGFVRILRTSCRTRTNSAGRLKVLADVYGSSTAPQTADIVIETDSEEKAVPWTAAAQPDPALLQISVFDSAAAQLYVDGGSEIKFLPFGLSLPYRLNDICLKLKGRLEEEKQSVSGQLALATITFQSAADTAAQKFYREITSSTTDEQIEEACIFSQVDEKRLSELATLLQGGKVALADIGALKTWAETLAGEYAEISAQLGKEALSSFAKLKMDAIAAREAARAGAETLFASEPLNGVGSETWRRLWLAAKEFSLEEAYPKREFPVVTSEEAVEHCLLCQQPLSASGSDRLARFNEYISGKLQSDADAAELLVQNALDQLPDLSHWYTADANARLLQLDKRDSALAATIRKLISDVTSRRDVAITALTTNHFISIPPEALPQSSGLEAWINSLSDDLKMLENATEHTKEIELKLAHDELRDRQLVSLHKAKLLKRRELLAELYRYERALSEVQTTGITKKANDLVDIHLTKMVMDRYEAERKAFDVAHLKVGLARKSGQLGASFQSSSGTNVTKLSSDILSEGEQRALALAAFLTEVHATEGSGPIVIDDPVSSLDRERGLRVALRLVAEAKCRQVVVFTHDLVFFNDLSREANDAGTELTPVALFSDDTHAGKIDPSGVNWKGMNVAKRLGRIRNDFAPLKKLENSSPGEYAIQIKGLYGRLRDTYERVVEEYIFCDVLKRGVDRVETQRLRLVHLSDPLAERFYNGMSKANTHSHDNPAADTVSVPSPTDFENDLAFLEALIADLRSESKATETRRAGMKKKD